MWGRTGGGGGGGSGPLPPGFNPPTPAQFFPPYPCPLFFHIFFGVPPPKIQIFCPHPPPIWPPTPTPPPPLFIKSPPTPHPRVPRPPCPPPLPWYKIHNGQHLGPVSVWSPYQWIASQPWGDHTCQQQGVATHWSKCCQILLELVADWNPTKIRTFWKYHVYVCRQRQHCVEKIWV